MVQIVLQHAEMVQIVLQHVEMVQTARDPSELECIEMLNASPCRLGVICYIIPSSAWTDVKTIKVSVKIEVEMSKE